MSDTEVLINTIQERPILWDKRDKNYHNRLLSHREWENLATLNGTTSKYDTVIYYCYCYDYYTLCKGCCSKYNFKFSLACAAARDVAFKLLCELCCGVCGILP